VEEFDATTGGYIKTYNAGGGMQWAGLYGPTGGVYIGDWNTNDVREYDATTGAFIRVVCGVTTPADMRLAPGNRLFIASMMGGFVMEVNATSGAFIGLWNTPPIAQPNDIALLPGGDILVTCMRTDSVYVYSPTYTYLAGFNSPGWVNPHGIEISPFDGRIYVAEGGAGQVHVFDPVTFAELNPAWLTPPPGDKIVDLEFRPAGDPTPATSSSWGRVKRIYRGDR
jgi:DNA-binding beta-propeller fold protein YncE